jgi:hypothetical protein
MADLPHLEERGGALILVTSTGAERGVPLQTAYCVSEHGIDGFVETLRTEIRREGLPISVTDVMPATITTPLFDQARTTIGVKPVAPPPVHQPDVVVDAVRYAAEHPVRDLVVGGSAKALVLGEELAPRLVDALRVRLGFEAHDTGVPESADAPDDLFPPGRPRHRPGRFDAGARPHSRSTSLQRHRVVNRIPLASGALAVPRFLLEPLTR